jgi:hypothetical protein
MIFSISKKKIKIKEIKPTHGSLRKDLHNNPIFIRKKLQLIICLNMFFFKN